ncbi:MAG: glutamate racemase [Thermoanaerobacteraceae bacterium]|nr:glutamate racemase [Thermoanaerobacteraceae bacterium]
MSDARPVGLFDSGVGGLTVSRQVFRLLPGESTIYFGDNAHVPYGPRTAEELVGFARDILAFLVSRGVKYVIFACNTNSSVSLSVVRNLFAVPMIGLIEPGAREAVRVSTGGRIGVIATEATIKSGAYQRALKSMDAGLAVFGQAAPRLVPLVEAGMAGTAESLAAVAEYGRPLKEAGIDTLILGCTHYPFLEGEFRQVLGPEVKLVDPAVATVKAAREEMARRGLLNDAGGPACHRYYVSGDPRILREAARCFLGCDIPPVEQVNLDGK